MTGQEVFATMLRWTDEYNRCALRHNSLIEALKEQSK